MARVLLQWRPHLQEWALSSWLPHTSEEQRPVLVSGMVVVVGSGWRKKRKERERPQPNLCSWGSAPWWSSRFPFLAAEPTVPHRFLALYWAFEGRCLWVVLLKVTFLAKVLCSNRNWTCQIFSHWLEPVFGNPLRSVFSRYNFIPVVRNFIHLSSVSIFFCFVLWIFIFLSPVCVFFSLSLWNFVLPVFLFFCPFVCPLSFSVCLPFFLFLHLSPGLPSFLKFCSSLFSFHFFFSPVWTPVFHLSEILNSFVCREPSIFYLSKIWSAVCMKFWLLLSFIHHPFSFCCHPLTFFLSSVIFFVCCLSVGTSIFHLSEISSAICLLPSSIGHFLSFICQKFCLLYGGVCGAGCRQKIGRLVHCAHCLSLTWQCLRISSHKPWHQKLSMCQTTQIHLLCITVSVHSSPHSLMRQHLCYEVILTVSPSWRNFCP